jgi:hypothetical protein
VWKYIEWSVCGTAAAGNTAAAAAAAAAATGGASTSLVSRNRTFDFHAWVCYPGIYFVYGNSSAGYPAESSQAQIQTCLMVLKSLLCMRTLLHVIWRHMPAELSYMLNNTMLLVQSILIA